MVTPVKNLFSEYIRVLLFVSFSTALYLAISKGFPVSTEYLYLLLEIPVPKIKNTCAQTPKKSWILAE